MAKKVIQVCLPLLFIGAFLFALMYSLRVLPHAELAAKSLKSPQQAAAPIGLSTGRGKGAAIVEPQMHLFDGFTRAMIPEADYFESPVAARNGAFSYDAQGFLAFNEKRGGYHLGQDLNGIGGQNSDEGDAVYCVADGMVVYAAEAGKGWGNVMVVAHRLRDGRLVQSLYGHLDEMHFVVGDLVGRGQNLATFGSVGGIYYAHLHFEMRESDGVYIGSGYSPSAQRWGEQIDPIEFYNSYNQMERKSVGESVLKLLVQQEIEKRRNLIHSAPLEVPKKK